MKTEAAVERTTPQSHVAEVSVLGAILQNKTALMDAVEILRPEDFYQQSHQWIFAACLDLFEKSVTVDVVTVNEALGKAGRLETVRSVYLLELVDLVPTTANAMFHARIVKDKALLRDLIQKGQAIVSRAYEDADDAVEVLDWAEQQVFSLTQGHVQQSFTKVQHVLRAAFQRMEAMCQRKVAVTGVATGFTKLDEMTTGFQPADLVVVAARPSMGKTSFSLQVAERVAEQDHQPVAVFSLEMTKESLVQRLLCAKARVESRKIRTGYISDADWPRLTAAAGVLSEIPVYIDDSSSQSVLEMRAKARRLKADHGLGLVIVDYLQLLTGRRANEGRVQEVSEISRSLKMMAKDLGVPVMALSQLSRAVEQRQPPRPQLSDLRDSGSIEQDADVVVFLYRPSFYKHKEKDEEPEPEDNTTEIIVGKQRNGPIGTTYLAFLQDYAVFVEQERTRMTT